MGKIVKSNMQYEAKLSDGTNLTVDVLLRWSDRETIQNLITPDGRLIVRIPNWEYYTEERLKNTIIHVIPQILVRKNDERFKGFVPLTPEGKKELTDRALDEMLPLIETFRYKYFAYSYEYRTIWSHHIAGQFWRARKLVELNPILLLIPVEMQRYILAHELTHGMLCDTNLHNGRPHGRDFFDAGEIIMLGFKEAHKKFKYYGPILGAYSYIND